MLFVMWLTITSTTGCGHLSLKGKMPTECTSKLNLVWETATCFQVRSLLLRSHRLNPYHDSVWMVGMALSCKETFSLLYYEFDSAHKEPPPWEPESYKLIDRIAADEGRFTSNSEVRHLLYLSSFSFPCLSLSLSLIFSFKTYPTFPSRLIGILLLLFVFALSSNRTRLRKWGEEERKMSSLIIIIHVFPPSSSVTILLHVFLLAPEIAHWDEAD